MVSKLLQKRDTILANKMNDYELGRCRNKKVPSAELAALKRELLRWVHHHDSTHGGKVPLTDDMIITQVRVN